MVSIAATARDKPIKEATVVGHLMEALVQGKSLDIDRCLQQVRM